MEVKWWVLGMGNDKWWVKLGIDYVNIRSFLEGEMRVGLVDDGKFVYFYYIYLVLCFNKW